jgi:hypothetical protein
MMTKLEEIYEGWKNYIFQTPEIEALAKKRIEVCVECKHLNILQICSKCICPKSGKARSPESRCPMNKWEDGWGKESEKIVQPIISEHKILHHVWDERLNDWVIDDGDITHTYPLINLYNF